MIAFARLVLVFIPWVELTHAYSGNYLDSLGTKQSVAYQPTVRAEPLSVVATKISTSHIEKFRRDGAIVLRGIENPSVEMAAAIATRLLDAPAVIIGSRREGVHVTCSAQDIWVTTSVLSSHGWVFEACEVSHPECVWADPLFGTRGTTPTSVVQWSKGTIF